MSAAQDHDANATKRALRWLLTGQIALALGLIIIDIGPAVPRFLSPSSQPELDLRTSPGDQTRRYRTRDPSNPGPGIDPDMPSRLRAEEVEIDGTTALQLRGAIAPGDASRIVDELRSTAPATLLLDSPGGSVSDALEIGRAVREIGAETRLLDNTVCLSACPYIFVGGVKRSIAENARIGVHQHAFGESTILPAFLAVEDIQRGQAEVLMHLDTMGIDLRIMGPAMATPADEIYILTSDELVTWNVTSD
ncbi:ATP-dependent Clp protease proteolytic subunit [Roseobacter sp. EG26]|uniref:ATP-dependent Clp protease proteolytic subunit n=1 Tax=Roseobacter sp. EG26 TaxID=3412477 RepID=UPI003CE54E51